MTNDLKITCPKCKETFDAADAFNAHYKNTQIENDKRIKEVQKIAAEDAEKKYKSQVENQKQEFEKAKKDALAIANKEVEEKYKSQLLDKDKKLVDISFEGEGCAISLASVSILTEILKGKDLNLTQKISEEILGMIKNKEKITINSLTEDQITTISSLAGVQEFPMRVKCATMVWHTFLSALNKKN